LVAGPPVCWSVLARVSKVRITLTFGLERMRLFPGTLSNGLNTIQTHR
jgi:hypothetical protein